MNAYPIIEALVIGGAIVFSAHQALRHLAPSAYRALRVRLAARLGLRPPAAPAATGCGSGCGNCGSGCDSSPAANAADEKPLPFVRKTPAAKP